MSLKIIIVPCGSLQSLLGQGLTPLYKSRHSCNPQRTSVEALALYTIAGRISASLKQRLWRPRSSELMCILYIRSVLVQGMLWR